MPTHTEAVPMPWNDENKSLICTTQCRRLSPLLMNAVQRAQVMVLLNSVCLVHLWNTTPKCSLAHAAIREHHIANEPSVWCLPICKAVCQDWKVLCKERSVYGAGGPTLYLLCCWGSGALGKAQHLVHSGSQYTTKHSMATNRTLEVLGWVVILLRSQQCGALALKEGRQSVIMDGWIQLLRKDRPRQQRGRAALDVRATGVHEAVPWYRWRAIWQLTGQDWRPAHGAWHCCGCLLQITWSGRGTSAETEKDNFSNIVAKTVHPVTGEETSLVSGDGTFKRG